MQLFAKMLETGLRQSGHQVQLIRAEPFFGKLRPSYKGIGKWLGYIDKFLLFPPKLCKAICWADVVHICDHSNAFYTKYLKNVPHLVTCHDLLAVRSALREFKENPTKWTGRQLQRIILNGLNRSMYVVCVSEATKKDLLRITKLKPENISVVYDGFNYPYSPMEKAEAKTCLKSLGIDFENPFILHVGEDVWYKNRLGVVDIFRYMLQVKETSHFNLVFAGDPLSEKIRMFIKKHHLEKKVFSIISPGDKNLCALYSLAEALLYPSFAEGFGWPIIEAQACGCPVFATNRAPMTETGGDAAVYIDPNYSEDAARIIAESLPHISRIKKAGFLNVKRFSAEKMLNAYVGIYQRLCVVK